MGMGWVTWVSGVARLERARVQGFQKGLLPSFAYRVCLGLRALHAYCYATGSGRVESGQLFGVLG